MPRIALLTLLALTACPKTTSTESAVSSETANALSLTQPWTGPYDGVPAFDTMDLNELERAIEMGMEASLAEMAAIANNPAPPTFDNVIVAMERSGELLDRVYPYYGIWSSNLSSPEVREVSARLSPKLAGYSAEIMQNAALFARVKAVYESDALKTRTPEEQRLAWLTYTRFTRAGALLTADQKARFTEIQMRLAELYNAFGNNVLHDEESYVLYLNDDQLGGLSDDYVNAAKAAAEERDHAGEYAVTNTRSSMGPFLTFSTERALREQVWRTYYSRGDNGDAYDNNANIAEILKLRMERANLLGFDNYAAFNLDSKMAKTPERAMALMEAVWPAAIARVAEEVADMQKIADGDGITIEPWDYRFYAEQVRKAKYDLDGEAIKPYLQLDNLRKAMFFVAGEVFGFNFAKVPHGSVPVFHPDVTVFEVTRRDDGSHVGLWYLDPFARKGKRSGAWATSYRQHTTFDGQTRPLASNNSNFIKAPPGEPVLISWDDANTLFHEFGHALHTLSSRAPYPSLNGAVRDYVEFQSQLLERWIMTDKVIDRFLLHAETGEPMPRELIDKIKKSSTFNQGFATTEFLASALIDMKIHLADPTDLEPDAFERDTLADLGMPKEIVMRHRTPQFGHVFSGEGYATGYYGYLWAEVLTADAGEAFSEAPGGFYDTELSAKMVEHLFSPQNAVDPAEAYRAFRGRDATIDALLRDRGFPVPGE